MRIEKAVFQQVCTANAADGCPLSSIKGEQLHPTNRGETRRGYRIKFLDTTTICEEMRTVNLKVKCAKWSWSENVGIYKYNTVSEASRVMM